jgi:uncharacterized protein
MEHQYTNQLIHENSPYLLQHAHNPVNWYAWNVAAFEKAKIENKPILVSIGYSTCHWCHVMERESFENEETAAFMNRHFICIKVDREERPDVDHIYMEAVQLLSGQGGWPLNCFLLPDARPFFAGTYYPPTPMYQRPSWLQVLGNIAKAYQNQPDVVAEQAAKLMSYMEKGDQKLLDNSIFVSENTSFFTENILKQIFERLQERFDRREGGFGAAPKFPSTMSLQYLLTYYHFSENSDALAHVELSLDKMCQGGIYDQLGGGFARYATDKEWLIPHFEKMLYDNALLISVLSDAYKVTKKSLYAETIRETLDFVAREMTSSEGGFYSAYDADSEGVEGKFYVWQKTEIDVLLGEDSPLFCDFYDVSEEGNWEEQNILWRTLPFDIFAKNNKINEVFLREKMQKCRAILFLERQKRIAPGLDDKILIAWNALMCSACCAAFSALGDKNYKQIALRNIDFLLEKFENQNQRDFFHTYKNGIAKYDANLEDYSYLIAALLDVYALSFDNQYLIKAKKLCLLVVEDFYDAENGLFYFASASQTDLILRRKELYDNAVPSGNSTMALNLQRLGIIFDEPDWSTMATKLLTAIRTSIIHHAPSFARYATAAANECYGMREIAIVGKNAFEKAVEIQQNFIPNVIYMASQNADNQYAMLREKSVSDDALIYLCQNYTCQKPVQTTAELLEKLLH